MRKAALVLILFCGALTAAVKEPKFFARRDYPSAGGRISIGDFNGDGIPDLVAVGFSYTVSTMLGNGDGNHPALGRETNGLLMPLDSASRSSNSCCGSRIAERPHRLHETLTPSCSGSRRRCPNHD